MSGSMNSNTKSKQTQYSLRLVFALLIYVFVSCQLAFIVPEDMIAFVFFVVLIIALATLTAGVVYLREGLKAFCVGAIVPTAYSSIFYATLISGFDQDSEYFRLTIITVMSGILVCGFLAVCLRRIGLIQTRAVEAESTDPPEQADSPFDD